MSLDFRGVATIFEFEFPPSESVYFAYLNLSNIVAVPALLVAWQFLHLVTQPEDMRTVTRRTPEIVSLQADEEIAYSWDNLVA